MRGWTLLLILWLFLFIKDQGLHTLWQNQTYNCHLKKRHMVEKLMNNEISQIIFIDSKRLAAILFLCIQCSETQNTKHCSKPMLIINFRKNSFSHRGTDHQFNPNQNNHFHSLISVLFWLWKKENYAQYLALFIWLEH